MSRFITNLFFAICPTTTVMGKEKTVSIRIIQTGDVHGCFFPYDFINREHASGSLARVSSHVKELRKIYGKNLLLMNNGDILQGQPTCYCCNYIKPDIPNIAASVVNYMKYDVQTIGNHDIETGHAVYDKWICEVRCPTLAANIIDTSTGKPYLKPYEIFVREGIRVAAIGMMTPAVPNWLNERLWENMCFGNILKSARQWIQYIKENESPDIIVGLFHSGFNGGVITDEYEEDATMGVAKEVPGFDLILYGHDHRKNKKNCKKHCRTRSDLS